MLTPAAIAARIAEQARMVVGAVADVLEDVGALGERRLADPVGALAAHLGVAHRAALHPLGHVVAADAGLGDAALGHPGRGVVRAAGAEIGRAQQRRGRPVFQLCLCLESLELRRDLVVAVEPEDALGQHFRDLVARERAVRGEQRPVLLVALADDHRRVRPAVEQLLELPLDQPALLLDHDDLLEPVGERQQRLPLERPDQAELQDPQAQPLRQRLVDAEVVERLAQIEVGLAGRDDPEPRSLAVEDRSVEAVGRGERAHRLELEAVQALLLGERRVRPADVEAARRQRELGRGDLEPRRIELDRGGGVDRVVDALEPDPAAAVAGQREAQQAELENLGDARRVEHRDLGVDQRVFALMRGGRALAGVVVAHQHEHAAEPGGAGEVAVLEHVAGAVDARALAVPDAEHAVVFALAVQLGLLRAPERGRGEVLVDARLEDDVVLVEKAPGGRHLLVEAAERRAAVAGDVARGVVAGREVALALQHRQPHQRLDAGQEDPALLPGVLVVEGDLSKRHDAVSLRARRASLAGCTQPARLASADQRVERQAWERGRPSMTDVAALIERQRDGFGLEAELYHAPPVFARRAGADLPAPLAVRRPQLRGPEPRRFLHLEDRRRPADRGPRRGWPRAGAAQRLPASRLADLRARAAARRPLRLPLPRLDLRPRRPAA